MSWGAMSMAESSVARLAVAGLLVIGVLTAMPRLADRLVYFPTRAHDGGTPASVGLAYEDARPVAADGVRLHAWFVPAAAGSPVVLFLHGNAGNVSHRLDKLALLHGLGAGVMLLDYRGYGGSEGVPDEPGLYRDADAGLDWLQARGAAPGTIVLYGESLGGTVAVDLAARRLVAGLVLESTPSSILAVARHHYPLLPMSLLLSARFDALAKIGAVRAPVLVVHGVDDEIVPFAMAEALYAAAPEPKRLVRLRGRHNDAYALDASTYVDALREFLVRIATRGA